MNKKLITLLLFFIPLAINAKDDVPKFFSVWFNGGQRVDLLLNERPVLTYKNVEHPTLNFVCTNEQGYKEFSYDAKDVNKFTFESESSDDINNVTAKDSGGTMERQGSIMYFYGFEPMSDVYIYNLNGILKMKLHINKEGNMQLSLNELGKGYYIIKTLSITYKIRMK